MAFCISSVEILPILMNLYAGFPDLSIIVSTEVRYLLFLLWVSHLYLLEFYRYTSLLSDFVSKKFHPLRLSLTWFLILNRFLGG